MKPMPATPRIIIAHVEGSRGERPALHAAKSYFVDVDQKPDPANVAMAMVSDRTVKAGSK